MTLQACARLKVVRIVALGILLVLSPQSSLSQEPNLALGQLPNVPIPAHNLQVEIGRAHV